MTDTKVADMTAASTLDGTELFYGVQGGADVKVTGDQIKTLAQGAVSTDLLFDPDATHDIGAFAANRPRKLYTSSHVFAGGIVGVNTDSVQLASPLNGVLTLSGSGGSGSGFGRVQFGGTDATFPAIKRNGAALEVKLADDSAYAQFVFIVPTSDPHVAGALWNNAGTLTISAG